MLTSNIYCASIGLVLIFIINIKALRVQSKLKKLTESSLTAEIRTF